MQRLKARLTVEGYGKPHERGICQKCKRPILAHLGETCLFDSTTLEAPPFDRIVAELLQRHAPAGRMTLEIPGGPSISYIVKVNDYRWSQAESPPYYELGRLSVTEDPRPMYSVELNLVGIGNDETL
jgi:hypothetical protein